MTLLTTAFAQGTHAARPAASSSNNGFYYYETDTTNLFQSTGSVWQQIASTGGASPLTTKGDLYGHSTVDARIPVGSDGQVLTADSAQTLGVKWAAAAAGSVDVWLVQILPWLGVNASSGAWPDLADGINASGVLNGYATNLSAAANTDYVEWKPYLSAGTWTLEWYTRKQTFMGIQTVTLDGSSIGTFDAYNSANVYNSLGSISGVTVAASGAHLLRFAVPTKNASATNYGMFLSLISLRRTA